ncbi:MAG TPA: cytochrome c oxidase assembly protein [Hyphomonas sp.]|nr:cytochrome c oxidase assembly protein [Hyphomonas sp.]MCB9960719.1 cytochrome c oxidase assembly protein [Hyphomonas sp.]MCB9971932.1 cytochrome c oxidase assembly protein [Hyphomonas sp.]HPE48331.1 cytochrome c oxidase assembly protein [Hyphomonas sp.]
MKLSNGAVAGISVIVLLFMLGLGMAAKPLYGTFCRVTGYGGTTRIATAPPKEVLDNTMMVRFDTNVADTPLIFRALQPDQEVHIGQNSLAFFEVTNPTDREIHVIAAYNVTPHYAGLYFNKLECFCFDERIIAPHETRKLPVVYFISPDIMDDRIAKQLETITLSYTFFDSTKYSGPKNKVASGAANSVTGG